MGIVQHLLVSIHRHLKDSRESSVTKQKQNCDIPPERVSGEGNKCIEDTDSFNMPYYLFLINSLTNCINCDIVSLFD